MGFVAGGNLGAGRVIEIVVVLPAYGHGCALKFSIVCIRWVENGVLRLNDVVLALDIDRVVVAVIEPFLHLEIGAKGV